MPPALDDRRGSMVDTGIQRCRVDGSQGSLEGDCDLAGLRMGGVSAPTELQSECGMDAYTRTLRADESSHSSPVVAVARRSSTGPFIAPSSTSVALRWPASSPNSSPLRTRIGSGRSPRRTASSVFWMRYTAPQ